MNARYRARKRVNALMLGISAAALAFGLFWLAWILGTLLYDGGTTLLDLSFYVRSTPPPGDPGGMANAMAGSAIIVLVATLLGSPAGILAGTYLA